MNNKNTEQLFFRLLRAGLWGDKIHISQTEDNILDVYRLAEEQSVVGLIVDGLNNVTGRKVQKEVLLKLIGSAIKLEQRNKAMNLFIGELITYLRDNGINALLVKGQGVAQCYKRPLWRVCGDIDLFLSEEDYGKAKNLLRKKASAMDVESTTSMHLGFTIENWVVELHGCLFSSLSTKINKVLKEIMNETLYRENVRLWLNGDVKIFLLDANNDILYTFIHLLGHFYKGGIGLRQVCDWCRLLWTYRETIDVALLEKRLHLMSLMSEWQAFASFSVHYLGMPKEAMPFYSSDLKWKKNADRICSFVLEVGNFGHNRDNSYFGKYPFVIRKAISFRRRCADFWRHASIFPIDSVRFFVGMIFNGLRSVARGE